MDLLCFQMGVLVGGRGELSKIFSFKFPGGRLLEYLGVF